MSESKMELIKGNDKKMRLKITCILLLIVGLNYAQHRYEWSEFGITFNSKIDYNLELMYGENEDQNNLWRLDSDEIGIEVDACLFSEQSIEFLENVEYAANEIAVDMEYKTITKGKHIVGNFRGYYVKTVDTDYDDTEYPVIIAAIIDDKNKLSFEIVIDCYDGNLQNGLDLLNSIKYKPKN